MIELFLRIFNMSVAASYLVLAVVLLRLVLKRSPKWITVALWGLVAIRLLCPFTVESVLSLVPSAETVSQNILSQSTPTINTGIYAFNSTINPVIGQLAPPVSTPAQPNPLEIFLTVVSILWVAGMALMALYSLISYWRLRRRVATAVRLQDNIFRSEFVASPFVLGFFRPKVYLSNTLDATTQDYVIAHERAHIRRRDHWWKPLGFLLLSIHWFNPLMWLSYILLCRDIELACDEKVIRELGTEARADYSQALLDCSIRRGTIAACPLAFGEVGVKERVKKVLNYKKPAFWIIWVAILACMITAACFLTDPITKAHADNNQSQLNQNVPGTAEAWYQIAGWYNRENGEFQVEAFPGVTFRWNIGTVEAVTKERTITIMDAVYLKNIGAVDLNMDGYPEICGTAVRSTEEHSCYVLVYDYAAGKSYTFPVSDGNTGFYLYTLSGYVMCGKERLQEDDTYEAGRLMLTGTDGNMALTIVVAPPPAEYKGDPVLWIDIDDPNAASRAEVQLDAFPGVTFRWNIMPNSYLNGEFLIAEKDGVEIPLFDQHGGISSVYVADVTGDGKPDICANGYHFFSGLPSFNAVYVYDYANGKYYSLVDTPHTDHYTKISYYIRMENGQLVCDQIHQATQQTLATGILTFVDGKLDLDAQITYDSPVEYSKVIRDEYYRGFVRLVTEADGTCFLVFSSSLNSDGTGNSVTGTYTKTDTHLTVHTDDGRTYTFCFREDDLVFLASSSSPLPKGSLLEDGMLLTGKPYLTPDEIG